MVLLRRKINVLQDILDILLLIAAQLYHCLQLLY